MSGNLHVSNIRDQQFTDAFTAKGQHIIALQIPYVLYEADFRTLSSGTTSLDGLAVNLFASVIVLLVTYLVRWVWALAVNKPVDLSNIDAWTGAALLAFTVVGYLLAKWLPNPRALVLKRIAKHFEENSPTLGIGRNHGR